MARLRGRPVGVIVVYHAVTPIPLPTAVAPTVHREQLRDDLARFRALAYPYGIVDQRVAAAAAAAGSVRVVTTEPRAVGEGVMGRLLGLLRRRAPASAWLVARAGAFVSERVERSDAR
jgi:uncharacterized protein YqjF (DUF2071 family)